MEEVKPEGWRQIIQPNCAAGKNSMSLLRRSSSWRRPGERGYYEGPAAQVNEPPRRARPQSCIEGGRMDKWLQTLERLQSRPLQKQTPQYAGRTVSTPVLPNEMMGSNLLCPDLSSQCRRRQSPSVCPSVFESLESYARNKTVHIKPAPIAERAQFCALAPVHFGWLPIQRHVILTDISNNRHDNSRSQKLKSPITPVLLSTPAKLNGPRPSDQEPVRPEPAGFRYWRTAEKNTSILQQTKRASRTQSTHSCLWRCNGENRKLQQQIFVMKRRKTRPYIEAKKTSPLFRVRKEDGHLVPEEDRKMRKSIDQDWRTPDYTTSSSG